MDDQDPRPPEGFLARFGVPLPAESLWWLLFSQPAAEIDHVMEKLALSRVELDAAIEALVEARLMQRSSTPIGFVTVDPSIAIASLIARAQSKLLEELEELAAMQALLPRISAEWARGRSAGEGPPTLEIVYNLEDLRQQIYLAAEGCKHQALNLHHSTTAEGFRDGQASDDQMIANGVRCRAIVGAGELDDPDFYAELEGAHTRGESFRALPEIPTRMLIFDRDLAVIAIDPDDIRRGAMFIRVRILIDLLIELFDHMWSVSDPIFTTSTDPLAPTGQRLRTLELMAIGTKDARIARTLGLSVRTIRRYIADMKKDLGVSSRAEVVAAAVRRGWI